MSKLLHSPKAVGGVYFAVVFVFSIVFWSIEDGFYQSTKDLEPPARSMHFEILGGFEEKLQKQLLTEQGPVREIDLSDFEQIDKQRLKLFGTLKYQPKHEVSTATCRIVLQTTLDGSTNPWLGEPSHGTVMYNVKLVLPADDSRSGFDPHVESEKLSRFREYGLGVPISEGVRLSLLQLSEADAAVSLSYLSAAYFSVVTITTLGYGDIVPVTDFARLLITLESVLGVILAGLFVNAVVTRSSANSEK